MFAVRRLRLCTVSRVVVRLCAAAAHSSGSSLGDVSALLSRLTEQNEALRAEAATLRAEAAARDAALSAEAATTQAAVALAAERLRRLRDALLAARAEPLGEGGGDGEPPSGASLIRLPAGVGWPQLGAVPLFVRPLYEGCYEGVLQSLDAGGAARFRKFTVIGNAGVGKSAFGAYVLWRAVQARRTVVYVSDKLKYAFVMHGDGRVEAFTKSHFDDRTPVLDHASAVLICDGITPPVVDAFTVLITSPVRERWKEFNKSMDARRLFFPVFSRAEMADMLRSCFPQLLSDSTSGGQNGVWERFGRWGGIPRYVLGKVDEDSQDQLAASVSSVDVGTLISSLDRLESEAENSVSHRLMHLVPVGVTDGGDFAQPRDVASYKLARSVLGSRHIKELVATAADAEHFRLLDAMLARRPGGSAEKLYGEIFENAALDALLAGGTFQLFNLTTGADAGELVLPASRKVYFSSAAQLAVAVHDRDAQGIADAIFVPTGRNYTAVDAVLGNGRALVNFTVNPAHSLKLVHSTRDDEGAAPVAAAIGHADGDIVDFYWALPRGPWDTACKRAKPFRVVEREGAPPLQLRQFALLVNLRRAVS